MKIERLRKSHRKEIIIGTILTVVIGGALTFRLTHSKYRYTESIDLAEGVIHYKVPDFKVMAMYQQKDGQTCTDDNCYDEINDRMPSSGYAINENKSYCNLNGTKDNNAKLYTEIGKHIIEGLIKGDKCYLYFDAKSITIDDIISSMAPNGNPDNIQERLSFSTMATTAEGVFKAEDEMYGSTSTNKKYSYYWRGAVTNNYVKFAGFCWRIIRINGDGSIRLIYDGLENQCHANGTSTTESIAVSNVQYNSNYNQSNYVGWTYTGTSQRTLSGIDSNAKIQTESWYNSNIGNNDSYKNKVANGKFCNDRNAQSGKTWTINGSKFYYAAYERTRIDYSPTFNCANSGDVYTLKVGAITADEPVYI